MTAALSAPTVLMFTAVKIQLPYAVTLYLLDGPAVLTFGGNTFSGVDPTYGALAGIEALDDGIDTEAPGLKLTIAAPNKEAAEFLSDPGVQGSPVSVWEGVVDKATGLVVEDPDLVFTGEIDVPTLSFADRQRLVEYDLSSIWERFFADDEGARLSDAYHQSIFPGELGLQFVTGVTSQTYWGSNTPKQAVKDGSPAAIRKRLGI